MLLGAIITLRLAGEMLGTVGFGAYMVARRALNLSVLPLLLGLGIALPRYVAMEAADRLIPASDYLRASLVVAAGVLAGWWLLVFSQAETFARLVLGTPGFQAFVGPVLLATTGLYLHTLLFGFFRGRLSLGVANSLQVVNLALIPPVALLACSQYAPQALSIQGLLQLVLCTALTGWLLLRSHETRIHCGLLWRAMRQLLTYGVPRLPAEVALVALPAVPVLLVMHRKGVEAAGFLSLGMALLQLLAGLFSAFSIILLPLVGKLACEQHWSTIRQTVRCILWSAVAVVACGVVALELSLGLWLPWLMGEAFLPALPELRWLLPAAIPYVVYIVLRSPLDALALWPYNSVNLVLVVLVAGGLIGWGPAALPASLAVLVSMLALGGLSWVSWQYALARALRRTQIGATCA